MSTSQTSTSNLWLLIKSEPYRLFFPLGWIAALIGVTYWLLVGTNITGSYNPLFHGLIQIELFASAFAVGFLLTALPKFLRTNSASNFELLSIFGTYLALSLSVLGYLPIMAQICFIFMLLLVVRFAVIRFRKRKASPPDSFLLVGFGLLQGVLGALLLILPCPSFPFLGQKLLEQGMLLCLSLGIGSFLGPRLMGLVDVTNAIVNIPGTRLANFPFYKDSRLPVLLYGILIVSSFFIETGLNRNAGFFLRAASTTVCLYQFGILKIPRSPSVVGILVAIALWSIALGLWLAALLPTHEVGALHLTYIGGFGLLILTIGGQVTSSHGGYSKFWAERKTWAILCAVLVILSAILRSLASAISSLYFPILAISAFCFDLALILWGLALLKYLLRKDAAP